MPLAANACLNVVYYSLAVGRRRGKGHSRGFVTVFIHFFFRSYICRFRCSNLISRDVCWAKILLRPLEGCARGGFRFGVCFLLLLLLQVYCVLFRQHAPQRHYRPSGHWINCEKEQIALGKTHRRTHARSVHVMYIEILCLRFFDVSFSDCLDSVCAARTCTQVLLLLLTFMRT